ncbi:MAG TPA: hypothetical protein VKR31_02225 [Rhizomicrobium sp.]|nr:hypothetical protein [Rhizomicrobium sp.]
MCRLPIVLVWAALQLFLTGCLPVTSSSPLGTTAATAPDPRLTGLWKGRLGSSMDRAYIAFYPGDGGARKIVVLAPPTVNDKGGWMVFEAREAMLGGNTYLDAREIGDDGKASDPKLGHIPVLYRFGSNGLLALYLIDEKAARTAIGKGAIAGIVKPGEFGDVTITASPATLDAFFASAAGRALFTKPLAILQRAK